jgi:hypothetical protein
MRFSLLTIPLLFLPTVSFAAPLSFTVNMSEAVNVGTGGGTPRIAVNVGGVTRYATYSAGGGTSALTFTYTPQAGDLDLDGVAVSSPVDLNGGTIADLNGNAISNLTFTPPNTANVKVDYPSLSMDFINSDYILSGTHYATLPSFLTAAGGTFTRNSVGTYFDSSGNLQTAAAHTPRFDYDPSTLQAKGILVEEQRTNGVRNNTMQGAVVGSPGTLPTSWGTTGANGISISVAGFGAESGISYIDIRFSGTTTTAGPRGVSFNTLTGCSATPSGNNKLSSYLKTQAGSQTNVSYWALIAQGRDAGGVPTGEYRASTPVFTALPLVQQRYVSSLVFTNAATNHYMPYLEFYPTGAGVVIDITVRIGMPQCEQGDFITSVIPTTNSAVTRQADNLIFPVGGWFDAAQGTMMTSADIAYLGGTRFPGTAAFDDGTASNTIHLIVSDNGGDRKSGSVWAGGVQEFSRNGGVYTAGSVFKQALAYQTNNTIMADDGSLGPLDSSVSLPTVTQLRVGNRRGGADPLNGHIRSFKYHPARVADTQLQLLTQ